MNKFIEKVSEKYSIDRVELYSLYNESSVDILSSMVSRSLSEVEEVDLKSLYPEYVELKESNSKKVEVIDLKRLKKGLKKESELLKKASEKALLKEQKEAEKLKKASEKDLLKEQKEAEKLKKEAEKAEKDLLKEQKEAEKLKKEAEKAEKDLLKEQKEAEKLKKEAEKLKKEAEKALLKEQKELKKSKKEAVVVPEVVVPEVVVPVKVKVVVSKEEKKALALKEKEAKNEEKLKEKEAKNALKKDLLKEQKVSKKVSKKDLSSVVAAVVEEEVEAPAEVVKRFEFEGVKYLKSKNTGIIYNMEQDVVGKWNESTQKIDFNPATDEEVEEEYDM